jgi:hypothetical protein
MRLFADKYDGRLIDSAAQTQSTSSHAPDSVSVKRMDGHHYALA